jgi:hypothetical protein
LRSFPSTWLITLDLWYSWGKGVIFFIRYKTVFYSRTIGSCGLPFLCLFYTSTVISRAAFLDYQCLIYVVRKCVMCFAIWFYHIKQN